MLPYVVGRLSRRVVKEEVKSTRQILEAAMAESTVSSRPTWAAQLSSERSIGHHVLQGLLRELSICRFWYPRGFWSQLSMDSVVIHLRILHSQMGKLEFQRCKHSYDRRISKLESRHVTTKAQTTKGKQDKLGLIEIKTFCASDIIKEMKRQFTQWENTFAN
ncbi:hypothetical protein AAY473_011213 [Plecturocebus cupreus]